MKANARAILDEPDLALRILHEHQVDRTLAVPTVAVRFGMLVEQVFKRLLCGGGDYVFGASGGMVSLISSHGRPGCARRRWRTRSGSPATSAVGGYLRGREEVVPGVIGAVHCLIAVLQILLTRWVPATCARPTHQGGLRAIWRLRRHHESSAKDAMQARRLFYALLVVVLFSLAFDPTAGDVATVRRRARCASQCCLPRYRR